MFNIMFRKVFLHKNFKFDIKQLRMYDAKVIDHYENPRNVGSFDRNDPNVGTGVVGAPACIHGDSLISVADGRKYVKVSDLYLENENIYVWSYNTIYQIYEIKLARVIKQTVQKVMFQITLDDNSFFICTSDHKVLLTSGEYKDCQTAVNESIVPFHKECIVLQGVEKINGYHDCYDLQVEENNNFAIITNITKNTQSGIILKNCGDVLKLQIKVEEGKIVDSCFKAFGCGSAIASSSYVSEIIKGKRVSEASEVSNKKIASELSLPPVKLHCSMLAEEAIKSALKDYESKNVES